jgi:hypothetical protein
MVSVASSLIMKSAANEDDLQTLHLVRMPVALIVEGSCQVSKRNFLVVSRKLGPE